MNELTAALDEARRRERLSHAEWRRRRAEVAKLIAAGEEAAARALIEQTESPATAQPPRALRPSRPAPRDNRRAAPVKSKRRVAQEKPGTLVAIRATTPRRRKRRRRGFRAWLEKRRAWVTSLAVHALLVVVLSLLTFGSMGAPGLTLTASLADDEDWSVAPVEVMLPELDASLDAPAPAIETAELAPVVAPPVVESRVEIGDLLAVDSAALLAAVPAPAVAGQGEAPAEAAKPERSGAPGKVRFFGAVSQAQRVVFVVDNSGSMKQGRLETTLGQLNRAVQGLSHSQEFYVVFFSDQAYPMFFPDSVDEAIPASRGNKKKLAAWLHTVEMCLGGRVLDAMDLARGLEPDMVYLLSDGDIRSEFVAKRLTEEGAWPFTIHTFGMGVRTPRQLDLLRLIASRTGGEFRRVGADPAAARRAVRRPIPYHRSPGQVWGSQVREWR